MYSGLLPRGLSEADLSESEEDEDSGLEPHSHGGEPEQRPPSPPASTLTGQTKQESMSAGCQGELTLQNEPSSDECLPGVPLNLWRKFKDLQNEREVQTTNQPHRKKRRKKQPRKDGTDGPQGHAGDSAEKSQQEEQRVKHWEELTQYFAINDRFQPPACSRPPLKSGLEKSMESAIAEGDYAKAEELSDRLATRELGVQIAQAANCRDFSRTKQEEEASRDARKRRKQVAWGFEAKKRWETKSNMGFM